MINKVDHLVTKKAKRMLYIKEMLAQIIAFELEQWLILCLLVDRNFV